MLFATLREDIRCVKSRDPACRGTLEVLFCYPGFRAVRAHRRAHWLYAHRLYLLARLTSEWCRFFTGVDIHPAATIGKRLFIGKKMQIILVEPLII